MTLGELHGGNGGCTAAQEGIHDQLARSGQVLDEVGGLGFALLPLVPVFVPIAPHNVREIVVIAALTLHEP
jgi:hypothetical protein